MDEIVENLITPRVQGCTILIIDDKPANLGLISDYLQEYGFKILVDQDGESGLETARYSQPDLILLDIKMPGLDGFETCRRLKADERLQDIPVIFMTALTSTEDKVRGFKAGAVDYVTKPLQPEEILARVVTHLSHQILTRKVQEANTALQLAHDELELRVASRTVDLAEANERLQQEITDRKEAEAKVRELNEVLAQRITARTQELSALYGVAAVASQSLDMKATLEQLLERVLMAVGCNLGAIHLLDDDRQMLNLAVQHGLSLDSITEIKRIPRGKGFVGQVINQGTPLLISNLAQESPLELTDIDGHLRICAGLPMRASGEMMGVLSVFGKITQADPSPEEMALLTTIADLAGVVVESARLRQRAKQAAVLEERERLARELHDSVTQSLYSLTLLAEWGSDLLQAKELEAAHRRIVEIGKTAQQALKEMRLLVYQLRSAVLEEDGLVGALQRRLDAVERRAGVEVSLQADVAIKLPTVVEECLYRIAAEALNNALKHAEATLVTITIAADEGQLTLTVMDNGAGFAPEAVLRKGGLGLTSMKDRAGQLGGVLTIEAAPGQGTTVRVTLEVSP